MSASEVRLEYPGRDLEAMSFADRYHRWIRDEFRPYLGADVAEVGAGSGNFSRLLLETPIRRLLAVEPSDAMFTRLHCTLADDPRVEPRNGFFSAVVSDVEGALDTVVYVNVLEHVEHDREEVELMRRALRRGGHACIFVPALPWLYSRFDASIGHFRRYRKHGLEALLRDGGLEVVRSRYFDAAGVLPWLVLYRLMGRSLAAKEVAAYDRLVVPVMRRVERVVRPPVGKNLLVVARKR